MCAVRRSFTQPGCPKSQGSRWPLAKPHDVISLIAHSPAAFRLGDPVTRGPYTSASMCSVCMTREWAFSSARIFALMSASRRGWAASGASSATQAIRTEKRLSMGVILLLLTSGRRRAYIQGDDDADPRVHGSPPGCPAGGHRCTARVRRTGRRAGASGAGAGRRANGARDARAVAADSSTISTVGRPGAAPRSVAPDETGLPRAVSDARRLPEPASGSGAQPDILPRRRVGRTAAVHELAGAHRERDRKRVHRARVHAGLHGGGRGARLVDPRRHRLQALAASDEG